MPVLDVCGDVYCVSGMEFACWFAPFLIPASSGRNDEYLSAAIFCVVDVPMIPAGRLKCYCEDSDLFC